MAGSPEVATVRAAESGDRLAAMRLLDGAVLEADAGTVGERIAADAALVAVAPARFGDGRRVVGVLVLGPSAGEPGPTDVEAVAVRRSRRGRGIGTALIEAALDRERELVAEFDAAGRPFYESLGFAVAAIGDGRYVGGGARR